jgi:hypothetical protein
MLSDAQPRDAGLVESLDRECELVLTHVARHTSPVAVPARVTRIDSQNRIHLAGSPHRRAGAISAPEMSPAQNLISAG